MSSYRKIVAQSEQHTGCEPGLSYSPLQAFAQQLAADPQRLCMVQPTSSGNVIEYNWARVNDEARCMASHLRSLGLAPGSHIALLSKNCAHWIMADLAIWMAGLVSVPIYPNLNATTIASILEHSDCRAIFVGKLDDWPAMKSGIDKRLAQIAFPSSPQDVLLEQADWHQLVSRQTPLQDIADPGLDTLATIIYTSGTSGQPKGVMHSFRNMANACQLGAKQFSVDADDRILSYLPLAHVSERAMVELAQFYVGFTIYFANSLETFPQDLRRARPTLFFAVPRIWRKLQQRLQSTLAAGMLDRLLALPLISGLLGRQLLKRLGLDAVRVAISGAAPLAHNTRIWYQQLGLQILEGYGLTENFAYSHSSSPELAKTGYVGASNCQVDCRIGADNEILIRSPATMQGYFRDPEGSREAFDSDGFFRTGDCGELDNKGRLKITGRLKELFKTSKGKYVAPAPIENKLLNCSLIEQACVTGAGHTAPLALLVLSAPITTRIKQQLQSLRGEINRQLDKHEQLRCLVVVSENWAPENGFCTPTLKLKRNVIDQHYGKYYSQWLHSDQIVIEGD